MSAEQVSTGKEKFSRAFWVANSVELLERAAYYGVFIVITIYLSRILGFTDIEAAMISGLFSAGLYLLPTFSGALADKMGFRKALLCVPCMSKSTLICKLLKKIKYANI